MKMATGYLVLSTGDVFEGQWLGDQEATEGEIVFNTAMTGYQEVMTDPSYAGQIVTMTYPLIGNYGFSEQDYESGLPALAGLVVSHPYSESDNSEGNFTLDDMTSRHRIPVLFDIDTRALTRIIREEGEVYGTFTTDPDVRPKCLTVDPDLVKKVSARKIREIAGHPDALSAEATPHVVVYDFGCKRSIIQALQERGCRVTVVPHDTDPEVIDSLLPDGIVLSNGPGDPSDLAHLAGMIREVTDKYPAFGICLGHQLIALAHGGKTKRLSYGHRGSNHPVKNLLTGKVWITAQNHGYVVDMESVDSEEWIVSHVNVNDQSVEGLIHRTKPVSGVQFHPEAHPGPADARSAFLDFLASIPVKEENQHA